MAGADKFGNIYFARLPQDLSDEIEEDPTGGKIKWEQGKLNGAPNKIEEIVRFHVGDVVTSLQKASLVPGGGECVIYGTVMGSLGALLAFTSREDVDFFNHLEMHMRQEHPPLCGRDHMAYRSAYFPVKEAKLKASRMNIFVRRGGPNYQTGLAKMRALGEELGVPLEVYGPEAMMIGICKQAIDCIMSAA